MPFSGMSDLLLGVKKLKFYRVLQQFPLKKSLSEK